MTAPDPVLPSDVPDLHDLTGRAFEERYEYYEELTKYGKIKLFKTLPARTCGARCSRCCSRPATRG